MAAVIVRQLVPAPKVEGLVFGVAPKAVRVMFAVTFKVLDHVTDVVPEQGIWITSPLTAVWIGPLMTAFTSDSFADAAVYDALLVCA